MMGVVELRPEYTVATERLLLRPLTAADTDALLAYRSLEDVCRYVPFEPMDADAIAERLGGIWARTEILAEGDPLVLGVELRATGRVIGDVLLAFHSELHRGGELGWVLDPAHSGHGYATEAAHAVMHLAFDGLGLHRLTARVDARNPASSRLAERLGMRCEAHQISNEWFKGEWTDELDYALLESEWADQHRDGLGSCSWPLVDPAGQVL
jgi:RimJ/RimL family protein N-acetyltransferase